MKTSRIFLIVVMLMLLLLTAQSFAIPAFARRYKISCSTCHAPFPKLKPYGDDFAGAGFILQEEEKERDYVSAGDDLLWLNKSFPIAARFDAYGVYEQDSNVENDLQTPYGIKLLSGGTLYKNIGYYFYFYMDERGEVGGVEDAYIHFDNVFKTNLDIMVGQFQTSDPLMKRELRMTFEDYQIYKTRIGLTQTNLAYDRGVMLVYGIDKTATDLVGFVVNGNGRAEAGSDHKFDMDTPKNWGARINQGIGSFGSIGFYYYAGKEELYGTNNFTYWGPDINLSAGPLEFTGQYLVRTDENPLYEPGVIQDTETTGIVAELIYAPKLDKSRFYFTALYNKIESNLDDVSPQLLADAFALEPLAYETASLSATYLLSRNLRLIAELTHDLEHEKNKFVFGLITAY